MYGEERSLERNKNCNFLNKEDKKELQERRKTISPIILEEHFLEFTLSRAIGCKYRVLTTELSGIVVWLIKETDQEKDRKTKKNDSDKCLVNISTIPRPILYLSEFVYLQSVWC